MKTFAVQYDVTMGYEAIVKAKNKKDAIKKVVEVIGEPVDIQNARQVTA